MFRLESLWNCQQNAGLQVMEGSLTVQHAVRHRWMLSSKCSFGGKFIMSMPVTKYILVSKNIFPLILFTFNSVSVNLIILNLCTLLKSI